MSDYIVPSTPESFNAMDAASSEAALTSVQPAFNRERLFITTLKRVMVAGGSAIFFASALNIAFEKLSSDEPAECTVPAEVSGAKDIDGIRAEVAGMSFGLSEANYQKFKSELDQKPDIAGVQDELNKVFEPFGEDVHINQQLPARQDRQFIFPAISSEAQGVQVPLDRAKTSANGLMLAVSKMPSSFLTSAKGIGIYLFSEVYKDGAQWGGLYDHTPNSSVKDRIVLQASDETGIQDEFDHELNHFLQQKQCGPVTDNKHLDPAMTGPNPASFVYSKDAADQDAAYQQNIVVSQYAATNANEDRAENGRVLLAGKDTEAYAKEHPIIAKKFDNIAAEQSNIEPHIADYYRYLGYINGRPFPKEIATATISYGKLAPSSSYHAAAYAECYGVMPENGKPMKVNNDHNIMVYSKDPASSEVSFGWSTSNNSVNAADLGDIAAAVVLSKPVGSPGVHGMVGSDQLPILDGIMTHCGSVLAKDVTK